MEEKSITRTRRTQHTPGSRWRTVYKTPPPPPAATPAPPAPAPRNSPPPAGNCGTGINRGCY